MVTEINVDLRQLSDRNHNNEYTVPEMFGSDGNFGVMKGAPGTSVSEEIKYIIRNYEMIQFRLKKVMMFN